MSETSRLIDDEGPGGTESSVSPSFDPRGIYRGELLDLLAFESLEDESMTIQEYLCFYLTLFYPDLSHDLLIERVRGYVDLLGQSGLDESVIDSLDVNFRKLYQSESVARQCIATAIRTHLNEGFLTGNLRRIMTLNGFDPDSREGSERFLYHRTTDEAVLDLIKNGWASEFSQKKEGVGTGIVEKHLGLNGVFCTHGYPYFVFHNDRDRLGNILVYSGSHLVSPSVVKLYDEVSLGPIGQDLCVKDKDFTSMLLDNKKSYEVSLEQKKFYLYRMLLLVLSRMMMSVIGSEALDDPGANEVVIPHDQLELPQVLIVNEEPEYFHYYALNQGSDLFDKVLLITMDSIDAALAQKSIEIPPMEGAKVQVFFDLCRSGEIDLNSCRFKPNTHEE